MTDSAERLADGQRWEDVARERAVDGFGEYGADVVTAEQHFSPSVSLSYGGHTLRYSAPAGTVLGVVGPRLSFVVPAEAPVDVEIACSVGPVEHAPGPADFTAEGVWDARTLADGRHEVCYFGKTQVGREAWGRLRHDQAITRAELVMKPRWAGDNIVGAGFPTDEYLMSRRLARSGGVLLHASSLVDDEGAYLFMGHSGAGKSTTAMNGVAAGAEVLSDDRTIVTVDDAGTAWAWGTPWHGSYRRATNRKARVRGIFLIQQAPEDRVAPLAASRLVGEAYVRLVHPTADAGEMTQTLDTLGRLTAAVRAGELWQRPTPAGFELARSFARGGASAG